MDIKQAVLAKKQLEKDISDFIRAAVSKFEEETAVNITNISCDFLTHHNVDEVAPKYIFSGCYVEARL